MPSLVTGDSYTLHIFFYGGFYDLFNRSVMSQVNDLCAFALHNAPHDIDGGIMPIK